MLWKTHLSMYLSVHPSSHPHSMLIRGIRSSQESRLRNSVKLETDNITDSKLVTSCLASTIISKLHTEYPTEIFTPTPNPTEMPHSIATSGVYLSLSTKLLLMTASITPPQTWLWHDLCKKHKTMYPSAQELVNINGMHTAPFKFAKEIRQADALPCRPVHSPFTISF
jgi:hypothetical protein